MEIIKKKGIKLASIWPSNSTTGHTLWENHNWKRYMYPYSQSYIFFRSHVLMWKLDRKEGWDAKNWCFWTLVLEKTLECPLDSKETKAINLKRKQPWIFIGRADGKYFGHLMKRSDLLEKTLILGKIEGRKRREQQRTSGGMASPTLRTCIWASSMRWWRTGKLGMLQSMGSQRVRLEWATVKQQ